jgi:hypothetical protein
MIECIKKGDVLNIILECKTINEIYNRVSALQPESVIAEAVMEKDLQKLIAERDQYIFQSRSWQRLDDAADSIIWAVKRWKESKDE